MKRACLPSVELSLQAATADCMNTVLHSVQQPAKVVLLAHTKCSDWTERQEQSFRTRECPLTLKSHQNRWLWELSFNIRVEGNGQANSTFVTKGIWSLKMPLVFTSVFLGFLYCLINRKILPLSQHSVLFLISVQVSCSIMTSILKFQSSKFTIKPGDQYGTPHSLLQKLKTFRCYIATLICDCHYSSKF